MSSSPLVSVVIPAYNTERYLRPCLESVLNQTLDRDKIEIVVVDDGSTDSTREVAHELLDSFPGAIVIEQDNSGTPGGARNPGIDAASGDFVFFLDADDVIARETLKDYTEAALRYDSDIVLGKYDELDGHRAMGRAMFDSSKASADLIKDKLIYTLSPLKLFRRSLLNDNSIRFPTDQQVGEDQPFTLAAYLLSRKTTVLSDQVYYYLRARDDGQNITNVGHHDSASSIRNFLNVLDVVDAHAHSPQQAAQIIWRTTERNLGRALGRPLFDASGADIAELLDPIQDRLHATQTPSVRAKLTVLVRTKVELVLAREYGLLAALLRGEQEGRTAKGKKGAWLSADLSALRNHPILSRGRFLAHTARLSSTRFRLVSDPSAGYDFPHATYDAKKGTLRARLPRSSSLEDWRIELVPSRASKQDLKERLKSGIPAWARPYARRIKRQLQRG